MTDPALIEIRHLAARATAVELIAEQLAELCAPHGLDPERVSAEIDWSELLAAGDLTIGHRGEIKRRQLRRIFRRYLAATHHEAGGLNAR